MKFLWMSNAPWAGTGYGAQTRLMLPALRELGHEPSCFAYYGLSGGSVEYDGYKVYPNSDFETWGNDVIKVHSERAQAELVVTLMDLFVLEMSIWRTLSVPWMAWVPIDCDYIGWPTYDRLKEVPYPVAMSVFGANQMLERGIDPAAVIPHAVDTDVMQPLDKYECRAMFNIPDQSYVVGMVMANKSDRKQYPAQLTAVKAWMDQHPDRDIRVYLHTEPTSAMGGWDMRALVDQLGLKGKVYSTNQYDVSVDPFKPETMAKMFNIFDVLMNCSAGEGFGIPIIEAQSCGVPVLATDVTAMTELVNYGYTVDPVNASLSSHYGYQFAPSVPDMVDKLEAIYRMESRAKAIEARSWVIENFSVPVVAGYWDRVFKEIEAEMLTVAEGSRTWL